MRRPIFAGAATKRRPRRPSEGAHADVVSALLIGLFLGLMIVGMPVSVSIGIATAVAMVAGGYDLLSIPQKMAASTQSIELMAVPFFILAASLMNALGITRRIFGFAIALVGSLAGGLAHANVI